MHHEKKWAEDRAVHYLLGAIELFSFMIVIGYILFALGCLVGLAGDIRFMVITYRHGFGWFFTCLFVPLVGWVFFLLFTKETWKPVALSLAGFVIAGIGYWLAEFQFLH